MIKAVEKCQFQYRKNKLAHVARECFRITDCSMSLSSVSSATSVFSRAFSSRSCFTSYASLTLIPPYLAFQKRMFDAVREPA